MEIIYHAEEPITPIEIGNRTGIEGFHVEDNSMIRRHRRRSKTKEGKTSYYEITEKSKQWVEKSVYA